MPDQQHPQASARTPTPQPTSHHNHHNHHHPRGADWMFGGVYGTVLASALLAALDERGGRYTPLADAAWILVTAAAAALAHGYAHHMADHGAGTAAHRWRLLARALWNEWPMIAATLPTLLLLTLAELAGWEPYGVTAVGLGLNTALLFAWGPSWRCGWATGSPRRCSSAWRTPRSGW